MSLVIDNAPPPGPSLREIVEGLQVGQSLCDPNRTIETLRVTASRVRSAYPERKFKSKETHAGPRIWRVA